jgi:uncharacterized protein involved in exopolysaccharide biosynthesis
MENNKKAPIDLGKIFKILWKNKKYFFIVWPIVFVLSCVYILALPRYYKTSIIIAPETDNLKTNGSLGSLASNFGLNLSNLQTADAITPMLYPELINDYGFVASFWEVPVEDKKNDIKTTYFDYLQNHQKSAWWTPAIEGLKSLFSKEEEDGNKNAKKGSQLDPYNLTKQQSEVVEAIQGNVKLSYDKKTFAITISVQDQSPVICKTVADTVTHKLQTFITDYRTRKARVDAQYYQKLMDKAKKEYEEVRDKYVHMADANTDVILESVSSKLEDLENDMQLKYNTYTTLQTQCQAAKAKVQERTPAFTIIKGAETPMKPAGPKRMIFVAAMLILATFFVSGWILAKKM